MAKPTYRVKKFRSAARPQLRASVVWKDDTGKRQKKFFNTIKEAETYAQQRETELLNQGKEALGFPSWLRVMAQRTNERLAFFGKTIEDAAAFYVAHLEQQQKSKPINEALAEYYAGKKAKGVTVEYLAHLRSVLVKSFANSCAGKLTSDVTRDDCEAWLAARQIGAATRNAHLKFILCFFNWAKERGYTASNPAQKIEFVKQVETPVGILTPDELEKLLRAADPQMLAYVAIGAFAGLRKAELQRLDWSEIDLQDGFIEVTAAKSKTAARRLVKILPCLDAWIRPLAKESGRVVSNADVFQRLQTLRRRAGMQRWPHNALRHSFASYHLAHFKDAAKLALEMGHTGNAMIFSHYRQVVREMEAARYWAILPQQPENVLQLALQNTYDPLCLEMQTRNPITKKFERRAPVVEYKKTAPEYVAEYGVSRQCISKWIRMGMPLDDRAAMDERRRKEYEQTVQTYAARYGAKEARVRHWMAAGWPLDNEEAMRRYLGHLASVATAREQNVIQMPEQKRLADRERLKAS